MRLQSPPAKSKFLAVSFNSRVAAGGADKLVRAFDVKTDEQDAALKEQRSIFFC